MDTSLITDLPLVQRLQIMEALWDSLTNDPRVAEAIPNWHEDVLQQRAQRLDAGLESTSAWDDVKQRLRDQTKK
ncbi:MAG: addiction module protein [Methylococcaceae bacterium]|jgi:putative addiction module component (TIGR02574 family)|nr:addiction module protein [Methylococcaceae bacterium]MDZ4156574.1 addiction module protein [Methylococcales bacterium]MDP2394724.1 addiction module protein [Methylococcaceae bacterium]MDP3020146.1 addiction module protein [Methylococcaceae bacterium]MDP3390686.1 addiction module protein [Methylococcaceae bacterium]